MIQPLIDEECWLARLERLPEWQPPAAPLVVIAPHPDDETLGLGGLIASHRARNLSVRVIAVTDGENAYPNSHANGDLGALRQAEQAAALDRLGVPVNEIVRLRLPDSGVASEERRLTVQLMDLIPRKAIICAPWKGDFHPDHEACGRAAETVARVSGAILVSYFFWTWHRGELAALNRLRLVRFPLSNSCYSAKSEALLRHQSQLEREDGEPILPENLLAPARRPFEVFSIS
jgi:LmbE family N-acetylglucosaminyl deacetylase